MENHPRLGRGERLKEGVDVWEELDDVFGHEELSAEDRLAELLGEGEIDADKPNELLCLAADLRNIYEKARESDSHHQLDDGKVLSRVLEVKAPTFHERFLEFMIERKQREKDRGERVKKNNMNHLIDELKTRAKLLVEKRKGVIERGGGAAGGGGGAAGGGGG